MENKYWTILAAIGLISLCLFCVFMSVALTRTALDNLSGSLTVPGVASVISAASVMAALYIAITGWKKSAEERNEDLKNMQDQKVDEIRRIAFSQAKTLFRESEAPWLQAQSALHTYLQKTNLEFKYVLVRPKDIDRPTQSVYRKFLEMVRYIAEVIDAALPQDPINLRDIGLLYQHDDKLGDRAIKVILSLQRMKLLTAKIIERGVNGMDEDYQRQNPTVSVRIYALMASLAAFLVHLEEFRSIQSDINYQFYGKEDFLDALQEIAPKITGLNLNERHPKVNSKAYIELFGSLNIFYEAQIIGHDR